MKRITKPVMMAQVFNPNTLEAEAGGSLSSRPSWSTEQIPGQPTQKRLHKETLFLGEKNLWSATLPVILYGIAATVSYLNPLWMLYSTVAALGQKLFQGNTGSLHYSFSSSALFFFPSSSNGNSSSWSSLGLEGDLCEDNLSFPTSDSDGPDDRDDDQEDGVEDLQQDGKTLLIMNIDLEPGAVDPQLRIILQWLVASEAEVAELYFHDSWKKEFILLSKQLKEKGWRVGDVLQAVFKYYQVLEKASSEERCKSLFSWLLENA